MKTKIIGLGNILMGDDGIGIHVVNELYKKELPPDVEIIDAGNCGWGLLTFMEQADKIIFIDALICGEKPGQVVKFNPAEVKINEAKRSPHHLSLLNTLALAEILGYTKNVTLIGVVPKSLEQSCELSPIAAAAVPKVIGHIFEEIQVTV